VRSATPTNLQTARNVLRACADKLEGKRAGKSPLPDKYRYVQLALGLCSDWQRWAAALDGLSFSTKNERKSSRREGMIESTRFGYAWTGANALFSRDEILELMLGTSLPSNKRSEIARFRILYDFAQLPSTLVDREEKLLNNLLSSGVRGEPLPGAPLRRTYQMWEVIFYKYITPDQRNMGIGKAIGSALQGGMMPHLDTPLIVYGARNWQVHGVLISSSFRGTRQKYTVFIDAINFVLSEVLARSANRLLPLI
jgi:hypothetical protein